ncbi:MAG: hypothetical protein EP330_23940 [Deltaproteobacteria bacterium]|nr:MAG: hypothetical protein EP330_23940 [Deltaproteobacteria bacterium]
MPTIDDLWARAQDALAAGDLDLAERHGRMLLDRRHSSAFEVLATVAMHREDFADAVDILEQGTAVAPGAIPLWQMLGNTLSELGRTTEAWAAYESALANAGGPAPSIRLNRAIFQLRMDQPARALEELDAVDPGPLAALFADARIDALLDSDRGQDALTFAASFPADPSLEGIERFHEAHAIAVWRVLQDPVAAATQLGKGRVGNSPRALWLLREIWGEDLQEGRVFEVVGEGQTDDQGFFQPITVVARDHEQATHFARVLGKWLGWSGIAEVLDQGPVEATRAGIYAVSGRVHYASDQA